MKTTCVLVSLLILSACVPEEAKNCRFEVGDQVIIKMDDQKGTIQNVFPRRCGYIVRFSDKNGGYKMDRFFENELR